MIDAAKIAVEAAEAMLGRYLGEDKWAYALNRMKDMGFNIESEVVLDALKAAWKQLDLKQLASGEKTKPPEAASAADPAEAAEG